MGNTQLLSYDSLDREHLELLDRIALQFEADLRNTMKPSIDEYLGDFPNGEPFRTLLLWELLALEWEYLSRQGECPELDRYLEQFPGEREWITSAYNEFTQARQDDLSNTGTSKSCNDGLTQNVQEGGDREGPTSADSNPASVALPKQLGNYEILRLIASGGFGRVLLAKDLDLDRLVAIKIAHPSQFASEKDADQYVKEARLAAKLNHPNIVSIHHVARSRDLGCYIVMDYIDGGPLDVEEVASRSDLGEILFLVSQIAGAVHHAHTKELIHRDLKPGNLLIDSHAVPYVVDFGLAVHDTEQHDHRGEISGTPPYMSPEQVRGLSHQLDGRTDIWSLGVLLYELVAGRKPFLGASREQVFEEILYRDPKPPRQINDQIPVEVEEICLNALMKKPGDRYSTALDFADDLRAVLAGLNGAHLPFPPVPPPVVRRTDTDHENPNVNKWRWPFAVAASLAVILAISLSVTGVYDLFQPAPSSEPTPVATPTQMINELPFDARLSTECIQLAFGKEGKLLAAAGEDGDVYLYNTQDGTKPAAVFPHVRRVRDICLSLDGQLLGTMCEEQAFIYLYSTKTGELLERQDELAVVDPKRLKVSPDPTSLQVVDLYEAGRLFMFRNVRTGEEEGRFRSNGVNWHLLAPQRERAMLVGYDESNEEWTASVSGSEPIALDAPSVVASFDIGQRGKRLVVGGMSPDFGVRLYEGKSIVSLKADNDDQLWRNEVMFFPNDLVVAVGQKTTSPKMTVVRVWRLTSDRPLVATMSIPAIASHIAFEPHGGTIGLAFGKRIRLFRVGGR